jgi:NADPH:quinone reductase-like Zn-dependent oxidoreductase
MRALVCTKYNSLEHLKILEVPKPTPMDNEVLIKISATAVTSGDWRIQSLTIPRGFKFLMQMVYGFSKPRNRILGTQLAGTIEAMGKNVKKFQIGDEVIAESVLGLGAHSEYICLVEKAPIAIKPKAISFEEAAVLNFGGLTALDYLKSKSRLRAGERILVYGASGSVGIAAVQLGAYFGARVTAVCSSANFEFVKSHGAENVIDYKKEDFTKNIEKYDVIVDAFGSLSMSKCRSSLTEGGRLLLISASLLEQLAAPFLNLFRSKKIVTGVANPSPELMKELCDLVEAGKFKALIDRQFPFDEIASAYEYVGKRNKKGNVVVKF